MLSRVFPLLFVSTIVLVAVNLQAATFGGFAAMGASESAGTTYTGSWVPYLANQRGLNFGGAGQPYNVAVGGATSATLLSAGTTYSGPQSRAQ